MGGGKRGQRAESRGQENRTAEQPLRSASAATEQPGGRMGHFVANGGEGHGWGKMGLVGDGVPW